MIPIHALPERRRLDFKADLVRSILPANERTALVDLASVVRKQVPTPLARRFSQARDLGCHTASTTLCAGDLARFG